MSVSQQSDQWLRKFSLVVSSGTTGKDLSAFRVTFRTTQADTDTPNTCVIRIYNLNRDTVGSIIREYTRVTLSAGYQTGRFGIIFDGTIKQFHRGKESNIDSFLDIFAADGDIASLFGHVNKTLPAGTNTQDQLDTLNTAAFDEGVGKGYQNIGDGASGPLGGILPLPRGKVMYGNWLGQMRTLRQNQDFGWSVINGKVVVVPNKSYQPDETVIVNSRTGMIGVPEATNQGITVKTLLNPSIKVYQRVQINNTSINQTINQGASASGPNPNVQTFPGYSDIQYFANVTDDGIYKALVVEHEGDTRGNPWYTNMVCLSLDPSGKADGRLGKTTDQPTPLPAGDVTVEDIQLPAGIN